MSGFQDRAADIRLTYKTADGLRLPIQVFLPDGDIHGAQAVVAIHGGGWNDAIKDNTPWNGGWMGNNVRFLAERGFIGIAISYRSLLVSEALTVADLLGDCVDALRYIRAQLPFVRFERIVYMGDSAGGYLATMLGLAQEDAIRPYAVVALNPVLELTDSKWGYGVRHCEALGRLLPRENIGPRCAKFLWMHGTADTVTELAHTEALHAKLLERGHCSELVRVPDAQHAFILYDYKYPDAYVTAHMERIVRYIRALP